MLKIRLQRVGRKHDPSYRIVATRSTTGPKSNKHIEVLGHYDAIRKTRTIDKEKVAHWIEQGAKISDTVHNILVQEKVVEGKKKNVLPKKSPIIDKEKLASEKQGTIDNAKALEETVSNPNPEPELPVEELDSEEKKEEE